MNQSHSIDRNTAVSSHANSHDEYLVMLGERVRNLRARRGMSRKMLAQNSEVSERYLAEIESGRGNISISLLRQLAQAMNITLEVLVHDGPERSVEYAFLLQHLDRLSEPEIARIYATVMGQSMTPGERLNRIALIGLRGAGKTTLGRALARKLGIPMVELVQEIEREAGISVNEIFSLSGQASYRRLERQCLENTIKRFKRVVISIGGSLVSEPGTYERLLNTCYSVWLKADPKDHMDRVIAQGDYRPMAGNVQAMDDLRRILKEREDLYGRADVTINTAGDTVQESLQKLLDEPHIRKIMQDQGV